MFILRQALKSGWRLLPATRSMASFGPLVDLTVDRDGIAIMTLNRPPVNSLNLDLLKAINSSLDEVVKNKAKGLILTSASPTVFSAGLDIMEMLKPDIIRAELWSTFQEVWIKLFGSSFATAAAINGHAPGSGCILSISCEWRAMVSGKYKIGLNETFLNIVPPTWFVDTICNTIHVREAEVALTTGRLFSVDEALKVGLIDEVATDKADAINKCKTFLKKFDRIPNLARSLNKNSIRSSLVQRLQKNRQADTQEFLKLLQNPKVQQSVDMYIQAIKEKAAK